MEVFKYVVTMKCDFESGFKLISEAESGSFVVPIIPFTDQNIDFPIEYTWRVLKFPAEFILKVDKSVVRKK